jgi:hypothetical protein
MLLAVVQVVAEELLIVQIQADTQYQVAQVAQVAQLHLKIILK